MNIDTLSFQRTTFYVAIGVSPINDTCCIHITNGSRPQPILQPTFDRKYIIDTLFTFNAPKKAPFGVIISNLAACGIYPADGPTGFIPTRNPDNQYYTSLPRAKMPIIMDIVRASVSGMCLMIVDDALAPVYTETHTEPHVMTDLMRDSLPTQGLDFNGAIVINLGNTTSTKVHYFAPSSKTHSNNPKARSTVR